MYHRELLAAAHICGKEHNGSDDWRDERHHGIRLPARLVRQRALRRRRTAPLQLLGYASYLAMYSDESFSAMSRNACLSCSPS